MADEKKPSRFEELTRRMGQTKQFPIDLQPINPAAPVKNAAPGRVPLREDKPVTEREAMQRVSALAARLRKNASDREGAAAPIKKEKTTDRDGEREG
jgi:hypothetical protein